MTADKPRATCGTPWCVLAPGHRGVHSRIPRNEFPADAVAAGQALKRLRQRDEELAASQGQIPDDEYEKARAELREAWAAWDVAFGSLWTHAEIRRRVAEEIAKAIEANYRPVTNGGGFELEPSEPTESDEAFHYAAQIAREIGGV